MRKLLKLALLAILVVTLAISAHQKGMCTQVIETPNQTFTGSIANPKTNMVSPAVINLLLTGGDDSLIIGRLTISSEGYNKDLSFTAYTSETNETFITTDGDVILFTKNSGALLILQDSRVGVTGSFTQQLIPTP